MDMSVKEFRKLSRDNNYFVVTTAQPLSRKLSAVTADELVRADARKALYVHRKSGKANHRSEIVAVIPLTKRHNAAEFMTTHPERDISKPEFNLIKEFTHND